MNNPNEVAVKKLIAEFTPMHEKIIYVFTVLMDDDGELTGYEDDVYKSISFLEREACAKELFKTGDMTAARVMELFTIWEATGDYCDERPDDLDMTVKRDGEIIIVSTLTFIPLIINLNNSDTELMAHVDKDGTIQFSLELFAINDTFHNLLPNYQDKIYEFIRSEFND